MFNSVIGYFKSKYYECVEAFFLDENDKEKGLFIRLVPKHMVDAYNAPGESRFYVKLVLPKPNYRKYADTPVWYDTVNGFEKSMFLY